MEMSHSRLVLSQLASDSYSITPSQEIDFYGAQMIPNQHGEQTNEWSNDAEVKDDLKQLLDRLSTSNTPRPCWT